VTKPDIYSTASRETSETYRYKLVRALGENTPALTCSFGAAARNENLFAQPPGVTSHARDSSDPTISLDESTK
jgi:hypothetical protein